MTSIKTERVRSQESDADTAAEGGWCRCGTRSGGKLVFEKGQGQLPAGPAAVSRPELDAVMRLPKIGGRDVDLHRLYSVVVARWTKLKLKQIYIRFSNKYDKVNFNGEEKDPTEEGNDEKRLNRRWSARMLHSVPAVYDHQQHFVPEVMTGVLRVRSPFLVAGHV